MTLPFAPNPDLLPKRLRSKIYIPDGEWECWEWMGYVSRDGGGRYSPPGRTSHQPMVIAYRHVWELLVGPIPEGKHLDHLCRVRRCVNPDHLEPVAHKENIDRGIRAGRHTKSTRCTKCGGEWDYEYKGVRGCRNCRNAAARRFAERKKARAIS